MRRELPKPVAYEIEQAGEEVMKTELKKLEDKIKDSEEVILYHFSDDSISHQLF